MSTVCSDEEGIFVGIDTYNRLISIQGPGLDGDDEEPDHESTIELTFRQMEAVYARFRSTTEYQRQPGYEHPADRKNRNQETPK